MKKTYRQSHFNIKTLYYVAIVLCILIISIGYSAFSTSLDVNNMQAIVKVEKNIKVTAMSVNNTTSNATSNYETYNNASITSSINLPNSNSSITYSIAITNLGNTEIGIANITGLPNNLTYSISNYNLKDMLCDDNNPNQCKLGSVSTIEITIGYTNNGYNSNNTNYQIALNFSFDRVFTINYNGLLDTSSLPNSIMEYDTQVITFNNTTSIPYDITATNVTANYNNPTLTLSNPTDNVIINSYYSITYNLNGGTNSNNNPNTFLGNANITLEDPIYTGFIFAGWYYNSNFSGNAITNISNKKENIVLYAKWINTITYVLNGGIQANNQVLSYQQSTPQTILNPTHTHDPNFAGWHDNSGLTGTTVTSTSQLSGNATLYAKWTSGINNTTFNTDTNRFTATDANSVRLSRFATSTSYQYTQNTANVTINSIKLFITYSKGAKLATIYCQVTSNSPGFSTTQNSVSLPIRETSAEMTLTLNNSIQPGYNYTINCNRYDGDGNGKYYIDGFEFLINP